MPLSRLCEAVPGAAGQWGWSLNPPGGGSVRETPAAAAGASYRPTGGRGRIVVGVLRGIEEVLLFPRAVWITGESRGGFLVWFCFSIPRVGLFWKSKE